MTKYRRKILTIGGEPVAPACVSAAVFQQLRRYSPDIEFIEFVEIGIDWDHVHLHVARPPKHAAGQVANRIKVNTSRQMKQKFGFLEKVYCRRCTGEPKAYGAPDTSSVR